MAIEAEFQMTDEQYKSYVISSLAAIQAKLGVLFEVQTHLMAKASGVSYEEQQEVMQKAVKQLMGEAIEAARVGRVEL